MRKSLAHIQELTMSSFTPLYHLHQQSTNSLTLTRDSVGCESETSETATSEVAHGVCASLGAQTQVTFVDVCLAEIRVYIRLYLV